MDDGARLLSELAHCRFTETFTRLDSSARSDPEREFGVLRVLDPEEQHAAAPVDDDDTSRRPVDAPGHHTIVTDGGRSRTTTSGPLRATVHCHGYP